MGRVNQENVGWFCGGWGWLKSLGNNSIKIAQEDPRRVVHSLKVGLAITLVSLFYYFDALYHGFGVSAMWAVITVVVVFEYSIGATIAKGVNRGVATLLAGALGVGAHRLTVLSGGKLEPVLLGTSVFLTAAIMTFLRFFPKLKARYDYGLMIFILTFCLVSVSGYRDDEVLKIARERLSTVLIGGFTALVVCVLIYPVWAGEDLHNMVTANLQKIGNYLEGFGYEYFNFTTGEGNGKDNKELLVCYKSVLNSKNTEEALSNFAKWEPRHGKFRYRHPWNQYLRIGALAREFACRIDTLNGYLNSEVQTPPEIRAKIQEPCIKMSLECSKALIELALAIKTMTISSTSELHIANAKSATKSLTSLLNSGLYEEGSLLEIIQSATMVSLLLDIFTCTLKISESVNELASLARFKRVDAASMPKQEVLEGKQIVPCNEELHHTINLE